MNKKKFNLVFIGPPGSGKGTLSQELEKEEKYKIISTGNILRSIIKENHSIAKNIKKVIETGHLVPDELILKLVFQDISDVRWQKSLYILDGFPQTLQQYQNFSQVLTHDERKEVLFVHFKISDKKAITRMTTRISCSQCHKIYNISTRPPIKENVCDRCEVMLERRPADSFQKARLRLTLYKNNTLPMISFIKKDFPYIYLQEPTPEDIKRYIFI
jgi:adenylate kinase